eukprot:gnl/TRDRNA2_/TRDRNA2_178635_c0_seq1.p1 gnl/TRDRNA2_/TRDRNA2_178635_c0~~gnl/TRDRNA2_/TRDRNA2_178635_c0_seq1.p1  ORF type:complete len:157 (-),score=37.25 gnl/TRDRNA2_/TRDRNA2_178635_c0_seq1:114-530(-)
MAMARMHLLTSLCALLGACLVDGGSDSGSIHLHDSSLRDEMRKMMEDDDDVIDYAEPPAAQNSGGFLQVRRGSAQEQDMSMDAYMEDSANALSAALGPRWDSKHLEADADSKTQALLKGISHPMGALNHMFGAMMGAR